MANRVDLKKDVVARKLIDLPHPWPGTKTTRAQELTLECDHKIVERVDKKRWNKSPRVCAECKRQEVLRQVAERFTSVVERKLERDF